MTSMINVGGELGNLGLFYIGKVNFHINIASRHCIQSQLDVLLKIKTNMILLILVDAVDYTNKTVSDAAKTKQTKEFAAINDKRIFNN